VNSRSESSTAIFTGLNTADTLLNIADAFGDMGEFTHEQITSRRVEMVLDKVEEILRETRGLSAAEITAIRSQILLRRTRSRYTKTGSTPPAAQIGDSSA
jgi:hypothetical protein